MENILIALVGLLPIIGGLVIFKSGVLITDQLSSLLLMLTHNPVPNEIAENPEVQKTNKNINTIGWLLRIIGVVIVIYGCVIVIGGLYQLIF